MVSKEQLLQKTDILRVKRHVTDNVTWPQRVKVMTLKSLRLNNLTTAHLAEQAANIMLNFNGDAQPW